MALLSEQAAPVDHPLRPTLEDLEPQIHHAERIRLVVPEAEEPEEGNREHEQVGVLLDRAVELLDGPSPSASATAAVTAPIASGSKLSSRVTYSPRRQLKKISGTSQGV
jgi:hypothetical protein